MIDTESIPMVLKTSIAEIQIPYRIMCSTPVGRRLYF